MTSFRSWCPDRTLSQARAYIVESAGEKYAEGVILNMERMWEESDIRTPLIGLLSMGSDPTSSIEALAKRKEVGKCALCHFPPCHLHHHQHNHYHHYHHHHHRVNIMTDAKESRKNSKEIE